MKSIVWVFCVLVFVICGSASAVPTTAVLTFDGVTTADDAVIPDGYGGFDWSEFYVLDAVNYEDNPSGFLNGLVSGDYVAYNHFSNPAEILWEYSGSFDFVGGYLTAAWRDGLEVLVEGFLDDTPVYSQAVVVDHDGATWFDFNFLNIDKLRFSSSGGTPAGGLLGSGAHFVLDDFTYIPEPATLFLFTFGGFGLLKKRRS